MDMTTSAILRLGLLKYETCGKALTAPRPRAASTYSALPLPPQGGSGVLQDPQAQHPRPSEGLRCDEIRADYVTESNIRDLEAASEEMDGVAQRAAGALETIEEELRRSRRRAASGSSSMTTDIEMADAEPSRSTGTQLEIAAEGFKAARAGVSSWTR